MTPRVRYVEQMTKPPKNQRTMTYQKKAPESIKEMFGAIAKNYDRTNAILSFKMHKHWNMELAKAVAHKKEVRAFLDLCCGTGEIAFNYAKLNNGPFELHLLDFTPEMLDIAKAKAKKLCLDGQRIHYIQSDAQKIPLPDEVIDCVTISYGIRNVSNPSLCIKEAFRVLRPGGLMGILELTRPKNPFLKLGHTIYLKTILPILGKLMTSNTKAYHYLSQSIQSFQTPENLKRLMEEEGFNPVTTKKLSGGIATIVLGTKPV